MARKEKSYHFIYKTTNVLTNRYYIGMHSTNNLDDGYLGSGRRLKYSINKYGEENHKREILEFLPNRKKLIEREKEIVNLNEIAKEECMNLMCGGKGGFISVEQQKKRATIASKAFVKRLIEDSDFRKKHINIFNDISKKAHKEGKIKYDTFTGKKHSEDTKNKISLSKKNTGIGKNNSQFGTMWITNGKEDKKIQKDKQIPIGWTKGRKKKVKLC